MMAGASISFEHGIVIYIWINSFRIWLEKESSAENVNLELNCLTDL